MSLALTNVDVLHHGWEDAVAEITPHLPEVRATMETRYAAAVRDNRLDEQSLLVAVKEVIAFASRTAGADTARLLSRAMHRAVYEYLLSLDALTAAETEDGALDVDVVTDPSRLIGVEEVAELEGRQPIPDVEIDDSPAEPAAAESSAEPEASLETPDQAVVDVAAAEVVETPGGTSYRPRFRLFRRGSGLPEHAESPAAEPEYEQPAAREPEYQEPPATGLEYDTPSAAAPEAATEEAAEEEAAPPAPESEPAGTHRSPDWWLGPDVPPAARREAEESQFPVAPRDGFHLTEFEDFVGPSEPAAPDRLDRPKLEEWAVAEAAPPLEVPRPVQPAPAQPAPAPEPADERPPGPGWHVRRSGRTPVDEESGVDADELAEMLDAEELDRGLELDPRISEARNDINDRLRRRRCDEAASLVQKLASEVGGRVVAELALDAGDRCRALGKGNAALSCYIAASRADPAFETPLLRLADVCLDDRDIDLAVTYLDRVARLHRMRGDTRGALRLYRKIATIAPYRDDILATLMRANSTGQFED